MDVDKIKSAEIITGGFPCQDISYAGEGAGLAGERSGLWWQFRRTIRMVRPRLAVLENVAALLTRGMGTVLGSLAQIGYDTEWHCLPASYLGAWHRRDRVWILAHPYKKRRQQGSPEKPILRQSHLSVKFEGGFKGWPGRSNIPTPYLCGTVDGISNKSHRIGSCGNAVYTRVPEIIGKAILESISQ